MHPCVVKLSLCGYDGLACNYDREQPSCGGKKNFVAHVNQITPTGPVAHTCCEVANGSPESVPGHDANDCFVYELPDGTPPTDEELAKFVHNSAESDNEQFTLLKNAQQVPQEFDGYIGYRMRLFMLKNKAPPMLIVKAIERLPEGYRITICRPRCNKLNKEEKVRPDERTEITGDVEGSLKPDEWAAAAWSKWSESKFHNYTVTKWSNWTRPKNVEPKHITIQGDQFALSNSPAENQQNSKEKETPDNKNKDSNFNINVVATGGKGGAGGVGGTNIFVQPGGPGNGSVVGSGGPGDGSVGAPGGNQGADGNGKKKHGDGGDGDDEDLLHGLGGGKGKGNKSGDDSDQENDNLGKHSNPKFGGKSNKSPGSDEENPNGDDGSRGQKNLGHDKKKHGNKNANNGEPNDSDGSDNENLSPDDAGPSSKHRKNNNRNNGENGKSDNDPIGDDDSGNQNKLGNGVDQDANRTIHVKIGPRDGAENGSRNNPKKGGRFGIHGDAISDEFAKLPKESDEQHKSHSGGDRSQLENSNGDREKESGLPESDASGSGEGHAKNLRDKLRRGDKNKKHRDGDKNGTLTVVFDSGERNRPGTGGRGDSIEQILGEDKNGSSKGSGGGQGNELSSEKSTGLENSGENDRFNSSGLNSTHEIDRNGPPAHKVGTLMNKVNMLGIHQMRPVPSEPSHPIPSPPAEQPSNPQPVHIPDPAPAPTAPNGGEPHQPANTPPADGGSPPTNTHQADEGGPSANTNQEGGGDPPEDTSQADGGSPPADTNQEGGGDPAFKQEDVGVGVKASGVKTKAASDSGGGLNAGGVFDGLTKLSCFAGETQVRTPSGYKSIEELEVGDMVLVPASGNLVKYERVEMFYHRDPEKTVQFLTMYTKSGRSLSLTALHLLPFGNCLEMQRDNMDIERVQEMLSKSRFAHKAKVGDCLLSMNEDGKLYVDEIVKIGRKVSKGIYSPMTVEGAIVANDVLASCFSQIESHSIQKLAYDVLIGTYNIFGYMRGATYETVQKDIPSMLNYVHKLSSFILPFAKY
uniref:Hint domain-containing protein n=1 Tax=Acrobeloides nanus TaxID=290746 RepID=A0A914EIL1_9BILA